MAIVLDHTIVPSRDPEASAGLLARILDVPWEKAVRGPFTPVYVSDSLTLDFSYDTELKPQHYCFRVSDPELDAILGRIRAEGLAFRSLPHGEPDRKINTRLGGRNIYWDDPDGNVWEVLTVSYARR